jgi:hypothetical protein
VIGNIGLVTELDPAAIALDVEQSIKTTLFLALAMIRHASTNPTVVNISSAAAHMNLRLATASYVSGPSNRALAITTSDMVARTPFASHL